MMAQLATDKQFYETLKNPDLQNLTALHEIFLKSKHLRLLSS